MNRLTKYIARCNKYVADIFETNSNDKLFNLSKIRNLINTLGKYEDVAEQGYVVNANVTHKRITYMRPVKRDYSDKDHPNYYKYTCPICDMLDNKHQVHPGETNCCLCNVNLLWEDMEE